MGSVQLFDWRQKAANKRAQCWKDIPDEWKLSDEFKSSFQLPLENNKNNLIDNNVICTSGLLTERELDISENYTVSGLLAALAQSKITALELTVSFPKRAAIAQQLVSLPYIWD
jgi:amidase